jgi:hypothetical protein
MKMTKFVLVLAFLVVMAAGAVVGMAVDRSILRAEAPPVHQPPTRPAFPQFPKISPEQKAKIDEIWAAVDALRFPRFTARHELDVKRAQEIQAILSPEQNEKYEAIQTNYRLDVQKLEQNLQDAVKKAEEQTRAVLNDEQRAQYDKWRTAMANRHGPGRSGPGRTGGPGGGGRGRGMRDRGRPTSNPTTLPSNTAAIAQ